MFAGLYPDEVGMLLADATPVDLLQRLPEQAAALTNAGQRARTFQRLASFGIVRLLIGSALGELDRFPAGARDEIAAFESVPGHWKAYADEVDALPESMSQVGQLGGLGTLPLIVLSATEGSGSPEEARIKRETHAEMAAISSDSRQIVVEGATHTGLAVNPDHASTTSAAIRQLVDAVRMGRLLST